MLCILLPDEGTASNSKLFWGTEAPRLKPSTTDRCRGRCVQDTKPSVPDRPVSSSSGPRWDGLSFLPPPHTVPTSAAGWSALEGWIFSGTSFKASFPLLLQPFSLVRWKRAASFSSQEQWQKGSCWWWRCMWARAARCGPEPGCIPALHGLWGAASDSSSTAQPSRSGSHPVALWFVDPAAALPRFAVWCGVLLGKLVVASVELVQHSRQLKPTRCLLGSQGFLQSADPSVVCPCPYRNERKQ